MSIISRIARRLLPETGSRWRELLGHSGSYLVGGGVSRALSFVFLIGIALVIPVEDYGYVNLYVSIVGLLAIIMGLGLPNTLVRFYFRDWPYREVVGTAVILLLASSLIQGSLLVTFAETVASLFNVPILLVLLASVGAPAIAFRQGWIYSLRARKMSRRCANVQIAEPLLMIAGFALYMFYASETEFSSVLFAYSGATVVVAITAVWAWSQSPGLSWQAQLPRSLFVFGLPLILHALAMTGLHSYDQIVIGQVLGPEPTGVYAFAYRFGMSMMVLCLAFSSAWNPMLYEHIKEGRPGEEIDDLAQKSMNLLVMAGGLLMLILPWAIRWIGGDRYAEAAFLSTLVVYGYLWFLLYTFVYGYLEYADRTKRIALGSSLAVGINVVLNYLFVPRFGIEAAALTTIISYMALFVLQWWWARDVARHIRYGRMTLKVLLTTPVVILTLLWT